MRGPQGAVAAARIHGALQSTPPGAPRRPAGEVQEIRTREPRAEGHASAALTPLPPQGPGVCQRGGCA